MIAIPITRVEKAIAAHRTNLDAFADASQKKLDALYKRLRKPDEKAYVNLFIADFKKMVFATPDKLEDFNKDYRLKIPKALRTKKKGSKGTTLKDKLITALGYQSLRSDILPQFYSDLGIKACVYCNAMLTISIEKTGETSGRFQADHYWPKADYPCFSVSLYNLYPVCGPCNNAKGEKDVPFKLHSPLTAEQIRATFHFRMAPQARVKYLLDRDINDIKIIFGDDSLGEKAKKVNDIFGIQGIYDTQKDVAEEIIQKAEIYKHDYLRSLKTSIPELSKVPGLAERILLGNYTEEKDLHKRPLAKYMMDIARDVGLIK